MSTLLLTGATGMLGREILVRALRQPRFDRVLCLVRPPLQRLDAILAAQGIVATDRVSALAGDVREPDLGLNDHELRDVTHVLHAAATVRFDHPIEDARPINVRGTNAVVTVARQLPRLERLDVVSTCYVAGRRTGLIRETELEHDRGFHNTYEQTKYEAELLLRDAMRDLPVTVHRPSIVVGDSRTGRTASWKVLYWPLQVLARGWLPAVPYDPLGRLDIVPVDFVADAVLALAADPRTIGRTFHLAAGPGRDTTLGELAARVADRWRRRAPWRIPPAWWRHVVRPALMWLPSDTVRSTLRAGLVYRPYLELRLRFDTSEADASLGPAGVPCPRVVDYIDTIVEAAVRSDFGRRPVARESGR
jgi:thioester reductase-like protein